jgi:penicillin-binding protein 1A
MAKPFFREFIKRLQVAEDVDFEPNAKFIRPPGDLEIEINCERYRSLRGEYESEEFHENEIFEDEFIDNE